MKLVVLRSVAAAPGEPVGGEYSQRFDTLYAARVLANLRDEQGFCTACGPDCIACRKSYGRSFESYLAGVIDFPATLPHVLEKPEELLPAELPAADAILAIAIHEQVLLEVVRRARELGVRGIVVPLEAMGWISPAAREKAARLAEEAGAEIAFPRPFCGFRPPAGSFLDEFRRHFRIGYPEVKLTVVDGAISDAQVEVSAACGATYCVARWLKGRRVDEDLKYDVVSKRFHSYPCTASMEWDEDVGDTVMHVASEAHCAILNQLGIESGGKPRTFVAPGGAVMRGEPRPQESAANIEKARTAILAALAERGELAVSELGRLEGVNPAAASSALILLKRDGRIQIGEGIIRNE